MPPASVYHPVWFYVITIFMSLFLGALTAYFSNHKEFEQFQLPLLLFGLCVPCITAITMIYTSYKGILIEDFWHRLLLFKINPTYLSIILFLMPCVILLATLISLFFGYSKEQFLITKELSVMQGWAIFGIAIPLVLAPLIEELGWRGYGVDSLRANFSLFTTSIIFGVLWAIWHIPAFFIKGYYHNQLWNLGNVYVANFFVSVFAGAFLMNWIYFKTDRSIPAVILFHSVLNLSSMLLRTEQFTKCIVTALLCILTLIIVISDRSFFFAKNFNAVSSSNKQLAAGIPISNLTEQLKNELERLKSLYGFPGATVAYVLSDGTKGEIAVGVADSETQEPMTIKSRMLAASIGKTFVAATLLSLTKDKKINLDDPLSHWLGKKSWFSRLPNHETITLRHLLTHSSGLSDHVYSPHFLKTYPKLIESDSFSPESLIEFIFDQPPLFAAGKGWAYTDTGYILLGLVIETVTGENYYDVLKKKFLIPLKLDMTSPSNSPILDRLAAGYTSEDNRFFLPVKIVDESGKLVWNPVIEWTGGGLISTSHDLAQWAKLLYEGHAMQAEYLSELFQSVPIENGTRFGAGVLINEQDPLGEKLGHGGVIPGYSSSMRYYSKHRFALAFQVNTDKNVSNFVNDMEQRLAEIIATYLSSQTPEINT